MSDKHPMYLLIDQARFIADKSEDVNELKEVIKILCDNLYVSQTLIETQQLNIKTLGMLIDFAVKQTEGKPVS